VKEAFGYGSLANRRTHPYEARHDTLKGWRRVWVTTAIRPAAFLSVERADCEIEGLRLDIPSDHWPDLDRREAHYDRVMLNSGCVVYSVSLRNLTDGGAPILKSYLDVVFQGFETEFGPEGLERFIETTAGWERGIFNDRDAPIYRRALAVSPDEQERYDALLASVPEVEELE